MKTLPARLMHNGALLPPSINRTEVYASNGYRARNRLRLQGFPPIFQFASDRAAHLHESAALSALGTTALFLSLTLPSPRLCLRSREWTRRGGIYRG